MKGLLRNNFYGALSNMKVFGAVMGLLGLFVVAMDNTVQSLIIGYLLLSMVGFPLTSLASLRKEGAGRWCKYKLTAPVRRWQIVLSGYLSFLQWLAVGLAFAGVVTASSVALHGFPFDRSTDVFMLFVMGSSVALLLGAIFFPLYCLGGEDRNEVFLVVSLLGGIGLVMGLITYVNTLFPAPMTVPQVLLGGGILFACAASAFALSCPLAVAVFKKKKF